MELIEQMAGTIHEPLRLSSKTMCILWMLDSWFGFVKTLSTIASILWRGWPIMMLCPLNFRGQSTLGPAMRYIRPVLVLCVFTKLHPLSHHWDWIR